jgi:hypothetical protein
MKKTVFKNTAVLISPILLFPLLFIPYWWLNSEFIVEWFGCGCPKVDEFGNMIDSYFNANHFTFLFWLFISACVTVISIFISKRIPKEKLWLRILYIAVMLVISLLITRQLCHIMMWD